MFLYICTNDKTIDNKKFKMLSLFIDYSCFVNQYDNYYINMNWCNNCYIDLFYKY